jgi:DNA-binding LytR/AlgR family response regulator
MRCIVIDDEPPALELMEDSISRIPYLELHGSYLNPTQAAKVLQDEDIDLVFCDIQMPGMNGLQLIKGLKKKPLIIFVTAYQEFALDGYELDVVDYLLKPLEDSRFVQACSKALARHQLVNKPVDVAVPMQLRHLFLYSSYDLVRISHADISYIEGLKDYVKVYIYNDPKPVISRISMKALQEQLPPGEFFRVHRSYLVNVAHIRFIRKGRITLPGAIIPYSDHYKDGMTRMTGKLL